MGKPLAGADKQITLNRHAIEATQEEIATMPPRAAERLRAELLNISLAPC